jgi:hypothetical protein
MLLLQNLDAPPKNWMKANISASEGTAVSVTLPTSANGKTQTTVNVFINVKCIQMLPISVRRHMEV